MFWPFGGKKKQSKHFQALSKRLEQRKAIHLKEFKEKHKAATLWAKKRGIKPEELASKSARGLAAGVAAGAMILSSGAPSISAPTTEMPDQKELRRDVSGAIETTVGAKKDVSPLVKKVLSGANLYDEKTLTKKLSSLLKIPVKAELGGIRLNTAYGIIGYESHLIRYPGDSLTEHFQSDIESRKFGRFGMAGGPGAWGYLAKSKGALIAKDIEREKYYLVAQTFLSPNWGSAEVKEWFRHRKMVVINPQNGSVVVGVLEDAGPDPSTGSSFGGSPEVMEVLGFSGSGSHVLMYFVDDPKDKIPLGSYGL